MAADDLNRKQHKGETHDDEYLASRRASRGAAAAAVLPAIGGAPAHAAAPAVGKQNAGFYRYKVGDIEVTVVTDGSNTFKFADNHVTNKTRDDLNKALEAAHQPKDLMTTPYNPIVVNTSGKLVVIDTGTGEAAYERSKGVTGQFQTNLKAAGIDRNAVDMVVISHFHGDHINGLITPDKKLAYPNAEILVPAGDWKFFMDDGEMSRASGDRMKAVFKGVRDVFDPIGRKVTPYEAGKEIAPGITAVATPGHTPGHTLAHHRVGQQQGLCAGRRHARAVGQCTPSGLARVLRSGPRDGGSNPPQGLRHARRRKDDGAGLPLSVPVARLCRQGR